MPQEVGAGFKGSIAMSHGQLTLSHCLLYVVSIINTLGAI